MKTGRRRSSGGAVLAALFVAAALSRLGLLAWAHWQDSHWAVRYTDIDYDVITDGARAILRGGSPFDRATYRYTPLLAWIAVPNVVLHPAFAKVIFCCADLLAAWCAHVCCRCAWAGLMHARVDCHASQPAMSRTCASPNVPCQAVRGAARAPGVQQPMHPVGPGDLAVQPVHGRYFHARQRGEPGDLHAARHAGRPRLRWAGRGCSGAPPGPSPCAHMCARHAKPVAQHASDRTRARGLTRPRAHACPWATGGGGVVKQTCNPPPARPPTLAAQIASRWQERCLASRCIGASTPSSIPSRCCAGSQPGAGRR